MALDNETEVLDESTEEQVDEVETVEEEQVEEGQEGAETEGEATEAEADEVVVTIGDEPAPEEEQHERAPEWVRDLRKRNQETVKENRELKKQLESLKAAPARQEEEAAEPEPSMSDDDISFDEDVFKQKWGEWRLRQEAKKREAAERERKKQEEGAKALTEWNEKVAAYEKGKGALKVKDVAEAEADAFEFLSVTQRGIALDATENPALVIYALGKNPKKAQELAAITNPIKFAVALSKLEKDMKVTPKRTAPLPESTVRGNARVSAGVDSTLERLRAEADRTGDRTKVAAYMRQQQAKQRA